MDDDDDELVLADRIFSSLEIFPKKYFKKKVLKKKNRIKPNDFVLLKKCFG